MSREKKKAQLNEYEFRARISYDAIITVTAATAEKALERVELRYWDHEQLVGETDFEIRGKGKVTGEAPR